MSKPSPDYDDSAAEPNGRYAALDLLDDEVVIYDRENDGAWIQSDGAIETASMA